MGTKAKSDTDTGACTVCDEDAQCSGIKDGSKILGKCKSGECKAECSSDSECTAGSKTKCATETGACVECTTDSDCTGGSNKCDAGTCKCGSSDACTGATQKCGADDTCKECNVAADCTGDDSSACDAAGTCKCGSNAKCTGATPKCGTDDTRKECTADPDCTG